jgi:formylglycine-generating enzyme required for sulfatase activity
MTARPIGPLRPLASPPVATFGLVLALLVAGCGGFGRTVYSAVRIENLSVEMPLANAQPARIVFDIAWDASFRDDLNWDAVWVFAKFREAGQPWRHARMSTASSAHRIGANNGVLATLAPSSDGLGLFLYRAEDGFTSIDWDQVSLSWDLSDGGVDKSAAVEVEVIALEMVYVPEGPFLLGDGTNVEALFAAQFERGTSRQPFEVGSEAAITLGGGGDDSLGNNDRRVSSTTAQQYWDDFSDSTRQILPPEFPKGFAGFYVMKHELTQGDYARFLNLLDASQQGTRNPAAEVPTGEEHRYAISADATFTATPYNRAAHWLSWMDLAAFADWSGLRPMTELEFEKAARGPRIPDAGEFAWGPEAPPAGKYNLQDPDTPEELVINQRDGVNVVFDGTVGLASSIAGPLRVAAFRPLATSRLGVGASYYRATEMSGNVAEMVVTVGRSTGRRYRGGHGDGELSPAGNAGGAEVELWPGARRAARGGYDVLDADGSGTRGGDWTAEARALRVSDREDVNKPADRRDMRWGGRLVRSAQ